MVCVGFPCSAMQGASGFSFYVTVSSSDSWVPRPGASGLTSVMPAAGSSAGWPDTPSCWAFFMPTGRRAWGTMDPRVPGWPG